MIIWTNFYSNQTEQVDLKFAKQILSDRVYDCDNEKLLVKALNILSGNNDYKVKNDK